MPAIIGEVNSLYDVDGFFTNGWPSAGKTPRCHCEACGNLADSKTPLGYEQHLERVLQIWKLWDDTAKKKKWDSIYVGNTGGGIRAMADGLEPHRRRGRTVQRRSPGPGARHAHLGLRGR